MTITGPGANVLAIDGGDGVTVFNVNAGVTASISDVTIQHGNSDDDGIDNQGSLTLTNSTIRGNGGFGINIGGGTVTVTNSTLSGNTDGIDNISGTTTVTNTIVAGNTGSDARPAASLPTAIT